MRLTLYIIGALSCFAIIFGSLFKILHYPGGNELFILAAMALGLIFVPLFAIYRYRKGSKSNSK